MTTKPILLLDQDDVLAAFNEALAAPLKTCSFSDIDCWEFGKKNEEYRDRFNSCMTYEFYRTLPVVAGAQDGVTLLTEIFDIYVVTATPNRYSMEGLLRAKEEWLAEHFPEIKGIISTTHKHLISGDIIVDDNPDNLEKHPGVAVLFSAPWNKTESRYTRAHNWPELVFKILRAKETCGWLKRN